VTGRIALTGVVFLVLAQLVPLDRTNPPEQGEAPVPAEVCAILERACYECHSRRTGWPWYA